MLTITIPSRDFYDERTNTFMTIKGATLTLEHSLVSVSKWESKWHKPFMSKVDKTREELIDYVRCMTVSQNINPDVYQLLTNDNIEAINNYINDSKTATTFSSEPKSGGNEIITSEIIYYWMIALQIPVEFQKWHLNRLLTLIRVCNVKNAPAKKRSQRDIINSHRAINEANKKRFHTKG